MSRYLNRGLALAVAVAALAVICGCEQDPMATHRTDNQRVPVDELFTHKGCTVYRFYDDGRDHYFADCRATVTSVYSCGKNCTRPEEVSTSDER